MNLVLFGTLLLNFLLLTIGTDASASKCKPIFVRWPRVKLNVPARLNGPFSLGSCRNACSVDENPHKRSVHQQCSAFNHRVGPSDYTNECHIFEENSVRKTDGLIEADDRYSFYWKYCLNTEKTCLGDYGFTFLSDRYLDSPQVKRIVDTHSLEGCLTECLNENKFHCRSTAYNRTSGSCTMSEHNQLSKPSMIKINNNPNYRVDYYENNCFKTADTFHFDYKCQADGFRVSVKSQYPYTGALYGLYDFFTCRIEPQELSSFEYLFPYPDVSRNCTDSIRYKGNEMILEVVLSTDGVEPLYFITADDLTYQARCPIDPKLREKAGSTQTTTQASTPFNTNNIELLSDSQKEGSFLAKSQKIRMDASSTSSDDESALTSTSRRSKGLEAITVAFDPRLTTKDIFPLPLFTTAGSILSTTTTNSHFDASQLNSNFGGIDRLTTQTFSTSTTTEQPKTTTTTTTQKTTTLRRLTEPKVKNPSHESFNFSTRITFPKSDNINVSMGGPARQNEPHTSESSHDLNTPSISSSSSTTTPTTTTTTPKQTTTTSTTQRPSTTVAPTTTSSTTPAPFTLFPTISLPTFPTIIPPLTMPTLPTITPVASTTVSSTTKEPLPPAPKKSSSRNESNAHPPGTNKKSNDAVVFDVYHNSVPTEAVVVGSRITLSFTPYYAIPPSYMSISGCQVEPINPLYDWEKEPLAIIKDGCQADHVGLVCPPQRTDYGIRVTVESFRYQTTTQLQYTCLIRICPFAPCPQTTCSSVEGCSGSDDLVSRTLGLRAKRELTLEQIQAALAANPYLQQQLALGTPPPTNQMSNSLQQQLIAIGGDHVVRKRLVVVNTDEELHYYVKTGELPEHHG